MRGLEKILRVTELVTGAMYIFGAISICALFLLMFGDVTGRFIFNAPIRGTAEVSEYLLVAIAFLSLGYAQLKGAHISVDTVVSHFPEKVKTCVNLFLLVMAICFFTIMTMEIGERAYLDWQSKILLSRTTVRLPTWWPSFAAAFGCALLVVSLLVQLIRDAVKLVGGHQKDAKGE